MKLRFFGVVQGVGFRPTVYRVAKALGLHGYVQNMGSNVEVMIDGATHPFIDRLKESLGDLASIERVETEVGVWNDDYAGDFVILGSSSGPRDSAIPADTALCRDCIRELFSEEDRRYNYAFTNCTNCGARFSLISDVPYDRPFTTMEPFKLCDSCLGEYTDPMDRRFHAQTISCPQDGPHLTLYGKDRDVVECLNPIKAFSELIDDGAIGVVKSWGGMHIVSRLQKIQELRKWYGRPMKPFAVMVKDLDEARRYAILDNGASEILCSSARPVTLVKKNPDFPEQEILEDISPGLPSIGIYLPYTGIQHLLFENMEANALVMTSANLKGEPMIIENEKALGLGLDCYLLHNREILHRIDDSVSIPWNSSTFIIRRSRGYVPTPFKVSYGHRILSFGAERNVAPGISVDGRLFLGQYIGDTTRYHTQEFMHQAVEHLISLFHIEGLEASAVDCHPQYPTHRLGKRYSQDHDCELIEVQHHWAHAASLMLDNGCNSSIICLTLDGTGYGTDGTVWGGEVLHCDLKGFERVGHLDTFPLIGGDRAILDPNRIVFALSELNGTRCELFDDATSSIFRKAMAKSPITSSFGRVLDALSCRLGICGKATYDGEPAMKLERYLDQSCGRSEFENEFQPTSNGVIPVLPLFAALEDRLAERSPDLRQRKELATGFVRTLIYNMVDVGVSVAQSEGINEIGLSGGVSYNLPITDMVKERVEGAGLTLLTHNDIPNGDGGISAGQNVIAGVLLDEK